MFKSEVLIFHTNQFELDLNLQESEKYFDDDDVIFFRWVYSLL